MNKGILIILFIVLLVPIVYSVPPITNTGNGGLDIDFPLQEYLAKDKDHDFYFHVFSRETGLPITVNTNCTFHLYNSTGNHIHTAWQDTVSNTYDFEFEVKRGNFSKLGSYNYIIQCECIACSIVTGFDDLGGFAEVGFDVTTDGMANKNVSPVNNAVINFLLIINLIIFFFPIFRPDFLGKPGKNEYYKEMVNIIIKRSLWLLAVFMMMLNIAVVATLAKNAGLPVLKELFRYLWIFNWTGYVTMVWLVISTLFNTLKLWQKNYEYVRMGN